nr:EAL domain-containing protein [uncultured Caldimonas sp.]
MNHSPDEPTPPDPASRHTLYRRLADAVLVLGLAASLLIWHLSATGLREREDDTFQNTFSSLSRQIGEAVDRYTDLATGLAAVFHASVELTRLEFHHHFRSLRADERYPALQALQFAPLVLHADKSAFEAVVRADTSLQPGGLPDFRIHPEGERASYLPVLYNEPFEGNETTLGYDTAAEPLRHRAMERARDNGRPAISAPLTLVQQGGLRGFVIRAPVYRTARPADSIEARRAAYLGQVSVVVRTDDLLRHTLADHDVHRYHVLITDIGEQGDLPGAQSPAPMFDSRQLWPGGYLPPPGAHPEDRHVELLHAGGRLWELTVTRRPVQSYGQPSAVAVLLGGLVSTVALWSALRVFATRYSRAAELAQRLSRQARESEARLRNVIDSTVDGIITIDVSGHITGVNAAALRMFGYAEDEMLGRNVSMLMPPPDSRQHDEYLQRYLKTGKGTVFGAGREVTGMRRDGSLFPIDLGVNEVQLDGERHFVGMLRDVSERRMAELAYEETQRQLRRADALRRNVYDSAPFSIVATDLRGVIQAMNPAAEMLLGYSPDELVGRQTPELFHDRQELALRAAQLSAEFGEPVQPNFEALVARARRGRPDEREWTYVRKDGRRVPVMLVVNAMVSDSGEPVGYMGIAYDVTERKRAEEHIRHMAHHDALTSLPNRALLQERLGAALVRAKREGDCMALMFIDLDRFKNINDSLGHHVGDSILKIVAERLRASVRASDTVARMGGDEFVVLLPKVAQLEDCELVARKMISALGEPMQVGTYELRVTPSIGVATFPQAGDDPVTLMRAADAAMYHAKAQGRNSVRMYDESMTRDSAERLRMENDLHQALERDELRVLYQPQFEVASGRLVGAEALLRWSRPVYGMVSPVDFIPLAEDTGLIVAIGAWVLREACRQSCAWEERTGMALRVAVNLSPRQLEAEHLADDISQALQACGLPPERLELEITESAIVRDTLSTADVLTRLRALGITIAIDDFGVGYSSMSYLRELPVDKFKIDRAFLNAVPSSQSDTRLAAALIAMAHTLQVGLVAEGVETREQLDFLRAHGCHEAQGYYLGRPVEPEEFEALIRRQQAEQAAP